MPKRAWNLSLHYSKSETTAAGKNLCFWIFFFFFAFFSLSRNIWNEITKSYTRNEKKIFLSNFRQAKYKILKSHCDVECVPYHQSSQAVWMYILVHVYAVRIGSQRLSSAETHELSSKHTTMQRPTKVNIMPPTVYTRLYILAQYCNGGTHSHINAKNTPTSLA